MDFFIEKLKKAKNEVQLDPRKKAEVKAHLSRIIEADKSVRDVVLARQNISTTRSNIFKLSYKPMPIYAVIAIIAILGGGTTVAAENSLPGDALYALKVGFNEEIRATFTFDTEAKANWEIRRVERRLEEASELSAKGSLNADARAKIEENFAVHAEKVSARIEDMEARGNVESAADLASKFETSLQVHQGILTNLDVEGETEVEVQSLRTAVNSALNTAVNTRTEAETKVGASGSQTEIKVVAQSRVKAASNIIVSVRTDLENQKGSLSADTYAEAEAQLKGAESLIIEAEAKAGDESYAESYALASQAVRVAGKIRLIIESGLELNLNTWVSITSEGSISIEGDSSDDGEVSGTTSSNVGVENDTQVETEVDLEIDL